MKPELQAGLYGAQMGENALIRQTREALQRCLYCGTRRGYPHHPLCKKAK